MLPKRGKMVLRDILGNIYAFEELIGIEAFEEDDYLLMFHKGQPRFLKMNLTNISLTGFTISRPVISFDINTNNLSMSCDTPSAVIYYTLDGSNPLDPNSRQQYTGTIKINYSSTLKVVAVVDAYNSPIEEQFIEITEYPILTASNYQTSLGSREGSITYTFSSPVNTTGGTSRRLWYTLNVTTNAGSLGVRECSDLVAIDGGLSEDFTFQPISISHAVVSLENTTCTIYTVNEDGSRDREYQYSSDTTDGNLTCGNVVRPQLESPIIYNHSNGNIEIEPDLSKWNETPDKIIVEIQGVSTTEYTEYPINITAQQGQVIKAYCVKANYRNSNNSEYTVE